MGEIPRGAFPYLQIGIGDGAGNIGSIENNVASVSPGRPKYVCSYTLTLAVNSIIQLPLEQRA